MTPIRVAELGVEPVTPGPRCAPCCASLDETAEDAFVLA